MEKVYMVLNKTDVSDLLWCVMNAPERTEAERKRHLKLHARLLKIENELKIAARDAELRKRRKERDNG